MMKLSKIFKEILRKIGQAVIASYNVLQHVIKGPLELLTKLSKIFKKNFPEKIAYCYNNLQCVITRY